MNHSYLSPITLRSARARMRIGLIAGIILTIFFGLATVAGFTDPDLRQHLSVYIGFLIPSVIPLILGIMKKREISSAVLYDSIFTGDRDGRISAYELKRQLGRDEDGIFRELQILFRKGYFVNCSLWSGEPRGVILGDAAVGARGAASAGVVTVRCPNCGASNRIQAGRRGKCEYCDAPLMGR